MSYLDELFPRMVEIVPEGKVGSAEVKHFTLTDTDVMIHNLRARIKRTGEETRTGRFAELKIDGCLVMSDTDMERRSHLAIVSRANGSCLVAGLGLGMVCCGMAANKKVKEITVIEKSADVIELNFKHINRYCMERGIQFTVVHADALKYSPPRGKRYDTIWFDIWPDISTTNLADIHTFNRRYARALNRDNGLAYRSSWMEDRLRRLKSQEKSRTWRF